MDVREKQSSERRLIDYYYLAEKIECPGQPLVYWDDIEAAPNVDAVPVTRCKDCKYMTQWAYGRYCTVWDGVNGMGDDGFCNYGERRGDNNNG